MKFELTDELVDQIMFAMEDQHEAYLVDSQDGVLVSAPAAGEDSEDGRYYDLPQWDSASGFQLMERFVAVVHNPVAKEALRQVLFCGKRVFRNYKDILKSYPEIENLWFIFKDREMRRYTLQWYNTLREIWGLEAIGGEPEDSESLVYGDFVIRSCNSPADDVAIAAVKAELFRELEDSRPGEAGAATADLWRHASEYGKDSGLLALGAETASGEFAGYVAAAHCPSGGLYTVAITSLIVRRAYRGLGIAKELVGRCLDSLRSRNIRWVFIAQPFVPETLEPFLFRCGFEKQGTGFILDFCGSGSGD
jgi:predicted N-acetyltransferase YhbS